MSIIDGIVFLINLFDRAGDEFFTNCVYQSLLKLLFLCKRHPMGRDLVSRPYGRFFYLPRYLASRGHQVHVLLLDYRGGEPLEQYSNGIYWRSIPFSVTRPMRYLMEVSRIVRTSCPDCVIGLSDTYYGILAGYTGRRYGICSVIDAYDNYESYIPWLRPLHWLWRGALRRADLLTAAGPGLESLMSAGRSGRPAIVVPMAPDPIGFVPMERQACRRRMGLPIDRPLIGYCGSMHKSRGIEVLFAAFERLLVKYPDAILVHSGRTWRDTPLPSMVHSLGYIEDEKMPVLLNCMNALVVTNRDSSFGNYSYPVKLYEAMSCGIPVVATRTAATEWILGGKSQHLVPPADSQALCDAMEWALSQSGADYGDIPDWETSGRILERALQEMLQQAPSTGHDVGR